MKNDKKFWDFGAKFYTRFMEKNDEAYIQFADIVHPYLKSDMDVLEIGCGTGQISFLINQYVNSLVATDFSPNMIRQAFLRDKYRSINFRVEDACNLSFRDNSFDCVVMGNLLHIVPDPKRVLSEVKRVLKPNGIALFMTFVYDDLNNIGFKLKLANMLGFNTYSLFTADTYIKFIEEAGYELIEYKTIKGNPIKECIFIGSVK